MYKGRPVVLASQSPRRRQLLEQAGIPFEVKVAGTDESFPADMAIPEVPVYIARQKAEAVAVLCREDDIVIAADTIVVLDTQIIGKPVDREDAIRILTALSGKVHAVITGVVIRHDGKEEAFVDTTQVHFRPLTQGQIVYYVDHYQPFDKAGAYAIQEWIGAVGIEGIHGCFYNVMGLPISRVAAYLSESIR